MKTPGFSVTGRVILPGEAVRRLNPHLYPHESDHRSPLPNPQPERDEATALGAAVEGKAPGVPGITVRFTGYRVRPLDPDNFAGSVKDLLDGLRHARLIPGDEPWRIALETRQYKVSSFKEEKTVVQIISL